MKRIKTNVSTKHNSQTYTMKTRSKVNNKETKHDVLVPKVCLPIPELRHS